MAEISLFTPEQLYQKIGHIPIASTSCYFSKEKCEELVPIINEINSLKKKLNAVILVHSYVSPEIIATVADFVGDSYGLSLDALHTDADIIVFCAVKFMAETAQILNPKKRVLIPTSLNGCTLADSITGADVRELRTAYPNSTFVCYINTTADVKAQCDVCVTSSNVYDIIEQISNPHIYFLPDRLMGENIIEEMKKRGVNKNIQLWDGTCYAHAEYEPEMVDFIRLQYPHAAVACHPECKPSVLAKSDFVGSTGQLIQFVKQSSCDEFFLLTECGLADRLRLELPQKKFIGTCTLCKYMKANTLPLILQTLKNPTKEHMIDIPKDLQEKAFQCIDMMFQYVQS